MLLGYGNPEICQREIDRLRPSIDECADVALVDVAEYRDLSAVEADMAVVFGGDGAILRAASQMGYRQVPMVGVNLGRLGFLADLSPDDFLRELPAICANRFRSVPHLMFECSLVRDGVELFRQLGLNETVVVAGPPFTMFEVHLYVDGEFVTTYSCDGLIIATPVGSTAHSLSAGGPILRKDLQAFVISPISPHTLTNRPVIDSAERHYEMVVPEPLAGTAVVVDGRLMGNLQPNDRVRIHRAGPQVMLVEVAGRGYYRTLREKLGWGGSARHRDDSCA